MISMTNKVIHYYTFFQNFCLKIEGVSYTQENTVNALKNYLKPHDHY